MRLRRLDLTRYGKFTGHAIDFGARRTPDLHLIYGPNEAGKSTALSAFLDLLFGVEPRSRYGFLHPYASMRIGAALEYGGETHEFVRVKRNQNDLLDASGQPVGQGTIAGQLGGVDRDSYRSMFSLDDDTLELGGESILESKGELGQLLFSASTGLAELSRALGELRTETDGFYKKSARGTEVQTLKGKLAGLKEKREQIDTLASVYAQLVEARDRTLAQYNEALAARTATRTRMDEIQRYITALPRLRDLREARFGFAPLAGLPDAPADWAGVVATLRDAETTFSAQQRELEQQIDRQTKEIEEIIPDVAALRLADRLKRLEMLKARYLVAEDIADRQREVRETDLAVAGILARMGRPNDPDPSRLLFDAVLSGGLRALMDEWPGIAAASEAAETERAKAADALEAATAVLLDAGTDAEPPETALGRLKEVVASVRDGGWMMVLRNALRDRTACDEKLAQELEGLAPWQGSIEDLARAAVPEPGDLAQWKADLDAAIKAREKAVEDIDAADTDRIRHAAERDSIVSLGVVDDQEAAAIRSDRDAAWARHRTALEPESADAFAAALQRDDAATITRLRHATRLARLHQATQGLAIADAAAEQARLILGKRSAHLRLVLEKIDAAIVPILPVDTTLAQVEAWLRKRERALAAWADQRQAERDVRDAKADLETARARLSDALQAVGGISETGAGLETLLARAQALLDRENALAARRAAVKDRERDLRQREQNVSAARDRIAAWQARWQAACEGCWLREMGSPPALDTVREIMAVSVQLAPELEKRASLLDRIDGMQADQRTFAGEAFAIAAEMELDPDAQDPLALISAVAGRVLAAENAAKVRARLTGGLEQSQARLTELRSTLRVHEARKAEITGYFGVETLSDAAACLSDLARKTALSKQIEVGQREILETLRLTSMEEAEQHLEQADRPALEAELIDLEARFQDQDRRARELFSDHAKSVDRIEAVGGDAAVARIEEQRRTIYLEIEEGALRYLRLRAGIIAAEHALRAYRQHHRSSMMAAASEAFRMISRDAYRGLASQPNKDTETLIAVAADGSTKLASELSKGTRFQLYLALRVAGYQEYARSRAPVPFIADDIMETFDDLRAEETLRLLARMAEVGQVIYLTHHGHLCDIARRICPSVHIHDLTRIAIMA